MEAVKTNMIVSNRRASKQDVREMSRRSYGELTEVSRRCHVGARLKRTVE